MGAYGVTAWSRSLVIAIDVVVLVWLAAMLVVGGLVRSEIDRLAATADSMTQIAQQESALASTLEPLRSLPFGEGDQVAATQLQLQQASQRTSHDAAITGASVHQLADGVFLLVVLLALFPILVFYIPMRMTRHVARRATRGHRRVAA